MVTYRNHTLANCGLRSGDLNDDFEGCLIETEQREDLCELILTTAKAAGPEMDEDVKE